MMRYPFSTERVNAMEVRDLPNRPSAGLTLIELVVAMSILAFGAVAGLSLLVQAQKASTSSRAKTMAINAAEQQLEAIFKDAPSSVLAYDNNTFPVQNLQRPGGGDAGLISVSATEPYLVNVSVVWEGQGILASARITLTALRTKATR
jgi:prepilin-type N-terminal cleavage/methylation domain-containing protein